jgi:serine O-acetyltransferase
MTVITNHTGELEDAIDAILESYEPNLAINNLESAALPNRRAVIEAFEHLAPIIYLGFYSLRPLSRSNLRYSLSEHVYPAYERLCEQIHRAVSYEERAGRMDAESVEFAHQAAISLFYQLPALRETLNEDAMVAYQLDPAARSVEEVVFSYPTLVAITAHRIAHVLYQGGVPMIPRILSEYAHSRTGIDINPGAKIGRRLFIDHGTGVVVGETAEIGDDVRLYQGVTLGALSSRRLSTSVDAGRQKRHPTIEDRVTVYAGATILGGETVVGADSVIGGNVWLVRSVPPGSKIFGRPRVEPDETEM